MGILPTMTDCMTLDELLNFSEPVSLPGAPHSVFIQDNRVLTKTLPALPAVICDHMTKLWPMSHKQSAVRTHRKVSSCPPVCCLEYGCDSSRSHA